MPDISVLELLGAAQSLIAQTLRYAPVASQHEAARLVARIDDLFATSGFERAPEHVLNDIRESWQDSSRVRIAEGALMRADVKGLWVSAWLRADRGMARLTKPTFNAALAALPLMPREVYTLRRVKGLSFDEIGLRLGLDAAAVETLFFEALRGLHAHIYSVERSSTFPS